MEIESYKVLNQLKVRLTTLVEQSLNVPNSSTGQLDTALFNVFYDLKDSLLSVLQRDLAKVVPVDLVLRDEEFFPEDDQAQGLCYCYYRFTIIEAPESFLVVRFLPFYDKILIHLKEPVAIKGIPKKLNKAFVHNPASLHELA